MLTNHKTITIASLLLLASSLDRANSQQQRDFSSFLVDDAQLNEVRHLRKQSKGAKARTAAPTETFAPTFNPTQTFTPTMSGSTAKTGKGAKGIGTRGPTVAPVPSPTDAPMASPTDAPMPSPTANPTTSPTATFAPTVTFAPSDTFAPTFSPTDTFAPTTPAIVGRSGELLNALAIETSARAGDADSRESEGKNRLSGASVRDYAELGILASF